MTMGMYKDRVKEKLYELSASMTEYQMAEAERLAREQRAKDDVPN